MYFQKSKSPHNNCDLATALTLKVLGILQSISGAYILLFVGLKEGPAIFVEAYQKKAIDLQDESQSSILEVKQNKNQK